MNNLLRFLKLYNPYKWNVMAGILLSLITVFAGISLLAVSGWFIASMGIAGAAFLSMNYFTPAAMIRGLSILRTSGRYGERIANHDAALRVTATFREWFYNKLEPLTPAGLEDLHSADVFSRLRSDIDVLERFYLNGIVPLCTAICGLIILGVGLALYYPPLAFIELSLLIVAGFIIPLITRRYAKQDEKIIAQEKVKLNISLADTMQGMADYLVYGGMQNQLNNIHLHDNLISAARTRINRRESTIQSITLVCIGLAIVGSICCIIPLITHGTVKPAELAMVALLCLACFDIITPLPTALQSLQSARMAAQRIFEITDRSLIDLLDRNAISAETQYTHNILKIADVSFSYGQAPVFKNLSFDINAGDVVVIVGRSGTGKSTIIDLLLGFRQPTQGTIYLNATPAGSYDNDLRRKLFSVVPQKPYIFADTLRANITLNNPEIDGNTISEACSLAELKDVIEEMPEELETYLGEHGMRLSGGQIRRLAIARAIAHKAPILILDEPVEGLDSELEGRVMRSVLANAKQMNRSVILCLHDAEKSWIPADAKVIRL